MKPSLWKQLGLFLSLFTSTSTLVCCALPALFVALGAGATLAGVLTQFPPLIWLSKHKAWVFAVAGMLLVISWWAHRVNQLVVCDPKKVEACTTTRTWSKPLLYISGFIYLLGAFFAFFLPIMMR
jgi:hypothetical protein